MSPSLPIQSQKSKFLRNENSRTTTYRIGIPWREIGLDRVAKEKSIGFDILVNDADTAGQRTGFELFGGILADKDPARYGRLLLQ